MSKPGALINKPRLKSVLLSGVDQMDFHLIEAKPENLQQTWFS